MSLPLLPPCLFPRFLPTIFQSSTQCAFSVSRPRSTTNAYSAIFKAFFFRAWIFSIASRSAQSRIYCNENRKSSLVSTFCSCATTTSELKEFNHIEGLGIKSGKPTTIRNSFFEAKRRRPSPLNSLESVDVGSLTKSREEEIETNSIYFELYKWYTFTSLSVSQAKTYKSNTFQTNFPNAYLCKKFPESVAFHFSPFLLEIIYLQRGERTTKRGRVGQMSSLEKTFVYVFIMLLSFKSCSNRICVGFVMKRVCCKKNAKTKNFWV